jgi:hypothetical protein
MQRLAPTLHGHLASHHHQVAQQGLVALLGL